MTVPAISEHPDFRPIRVAATKASGALDLNKKLIADAAQLDPNAIAPGFTANAKYDLTDHGGKKVPNMVIQSIFVSNSTSTWAASDRTNIDNALTSAFADVNLNSVMAQYYDQPITTIYLPSKTLTGTLSVYKASDVTDFVTARYKDNTLSGDFANTCFCFMLSPGVQLFAPDGSDSHAGLGGFHGSVDCTRPGASDRVYFAVGVYSQVISPTITNGIVAFSDSWRNVCGTFYHELNEFRTDPDVGNGKLGWYSDTYGEIGDIPLDEAGSSLSTVLLNVALADGSGSVPVQLMYSNKDHGPSAGDEIPFFLFHAWQTVANGGWTGAWPLGGYALQIAVARNADGRLEVFYVGTNNDIYHNWQTAPNGGWHGEVALGGAALQLAVGVNADGRLEVFYVGTNNEIYHNWQTAPNGGWAGENALGGSAKRVAIARNKDGRLELFYVGTNDDLYHNWQTAPNGGWAGENQFAGDSAKDLTVGQNADGRLEMFYVGTNNDLYHNWQTAPNGGWAGEKQFAGDSAKQIVAARNEDGRLEIFYVGTNNALYHNWQKTPGGVWNGETRFPQNSANQIAVAANADGRLEIFYVGTDTNVYHNWQTAPNGGWSGETRLGGQAKQVAVGNNADGRLELFYIGD